MQKISRALISFAFVADRFESTRGDIFQGLVPLFAPIVTEKQGTVFEPETFVAELRSRYDILMPVPVAEDWAHRLEREQYLTREQVAPGHFRYRYNAIDAAVTADHSSRVALLLSEFSRFVAASPARGDLPADLDLENELFERLLNLDSLAIFHRPDKAYPIRRSSKTLTLRPPQQEDDKAPTRNPVAERLDFLFGAFVDQIREQKPELLNVMSDVMTGALLAEVVLGIQSPPSKGDEFETTDIYFDAPLIMDLLGINPGRKEYAEELIAALRDCKARLWIFDHSIDEIERIILHSVESTNRAAEQPLGYRYRTPAATADKLYLLSIRGHVAAELQKRGIKINSLQGDPYQRSLKYFSEDDEEELMGEIGMYLYVDAKVADAKSLAHVIRLRGASDVHTNVLRSRAVLVSRNGRLVNRAARYVVAKQNAARQNRAPYLYRPGDAPICITDSYLLGLIWITRGGTTKSLSRSRLVANCAAAMAPRRDLTTKMFNLLLQSDGQKAARFEAIMIDERAERYLMVITLGDDSLITNENVERLYDDVRRVTAQELTKEHEQELEQQAKKNASEAVKLRAEYDHKLAEVEQRAQAVRSALTNQLLDERTDGLKLRDELATIKDRYDQVAAAVASIDSALQSERRQRILPAFLEARELRQRFPLLMGLLLGSLVYLGGKLLTRVVIDPTHELVGEVLLWVLAVGGFCLAFWEIPAQIFTGVRNALATTVFRARAVGMGAGDLLKHYKPDWEKEELIAIPAVTGATRPPDIQT